MAFPELPGLDDVVTFEMGFKFRDHLIKLLGDTSNQHRIYKYIAAANDIFWADKSGTAIDTLMGYDFLNMSDLPAFRSNTELSSLLKAIKVHAEVLGTDGIFPEGIFQSMR